MEIKIIGEEGRHAVFSLSADEHSWFRSNSPPNACLAKLISANSELHLIVSFVMRFPLLLTQPRLSNVSPGGCWGWGSSSRDVSLQLLDSSMALLSSSSWNFTANFLSARCIFFMVLRDGFLTRSSMLMTIGMGAWSLMISSSPWVMSHSQSPSPLHLAPALKLPDSFSALYLFCWSSRDRLSPIGTGGGGATEGSAEGLFSVKA